MVDTVIRVENLGKRYRIGQLEAYKTLRDTISRVVVAPVKGVSSKLSRGKSPAAKYGSRNYIWALRNVSLEVKQGEVLGIIGRNGAGKSTLLKILARITEPTEGFAEIRGRVGSLLEVGTGFHPELTGRENVYLNGAILGMKKAEVESKFDQIVAFAEVEEFIDTPVKRYSSGMYVRLAFAVGAHLEPDILLVDEVLAVGDARFWSKCMEKVRSLRDQGITILLVTHNMWQVQTVCTRAICLEKGQILSEGSPVRVIEDYRRMTERFPLGKAVEGHREEAAEIITFQVFPEGEWGKDGQALPESGVRVLITARARHIDLVRFLVRVTSPDGFSYFTVYSNPTPVVENHKIIRCEAYIPHLLLTPGNYILWAAICTAAGERDMLSHESVPIVVASKAGDDWDARYGIFRNLCEWQIKVEPEGAIHE